MKFITATFVFFCATTSVFGATIKPATTALCTSFASGGLSNLEELGCPASLISKVPVVPGAKEKICLAMHDGGLDNLDAVGCDATLFNKRGRSCSNSDICEILSTSLLDVNLFNCNNRGRSKRRHGDDDCSASICRIASTAGVSLLGFNCNN
ncbi:hypothetical protein CF319_g8981 [Tilletia indica]|nr:hypothetical protein CF319_g8981 [Tilletia indica]